MRLKLPSGDVAEFATPEERADLVRRLDDLIAQLKDDRAAILHARLPEREPEPAAT